MKKTLTLIRGLPGSGKSTLAKKLKNDDTVHIENDFYFIRNGVYKFEGEQLQAAIEFCYNKAEKYLKLNYNVIVSNTFVKNEHIWPYIDMAIENNAQLQIIECTGTFKNVHNVPIETLDRMRYTWETLQI